MRVLLVDDSPAVQTSFGGLLRSVPQVELIGCAADVAGALAMVEALLPDVVVLDLELRGGERGLSVLRRLKRKRPAVEVIVLSNFGWQAMRSELMAAGAAAYFDKAEEFMLAREWIAARAAAEQPGVRAPEP